MDSFWLGVLVSIPIAIAVNLVTPHLQQLIGKGSQRVRHNSKLKALAILGQARRLEANQAYAAATFAHLHLVVGWAMALALTGFILPLLLMSPMADSIPRPIPTILSLVFMGFSSALLIVGMNMIEYVRTYRLALRDVDAFERMVVNKHGPLPEPASNVFD